MSYDELIYLLECIGYCNLFLIRNVARFSVNTKKKLRKKEDLHNTALSFLKRIDKRSHFYESGRYPNHLYLKDYNKLKRENCLILS